LRAAPLCSSSQATFRQQRNLLCARGKDVPGEPADQPGEAAGRLARPLLDHDVVQRRAGSGRHACTVIDRQDPIVPVAAPESILPFEQTRIHHGNERGILEQAERRFRSA
jgi:hypothetical protein